MNELGTCYGAGATPEIKKSMVRRSWRQPSGLPPRAMRVRVRAAPRCCARNYQLAARPCSSLSTRVRICAWQKHVSSYIAHEQRTPNDVSLKLRSQSPLGDVTGHGRERVGSADAEFEGGVAWSRCGVSALYDPAARRGMEGYVRPAQPCYFSPADTRYSLPASRTVLRPPRAMTVRVRVPCMHSDLVTRVARSANIHPDRPGVFHRQVNRVIADEPPVDGNHTAEKKAAARLAKLEAERAAERARCRERRARNKGKARMSSSASSTGDALVTITEAMHLSHRLLAIFQQPPPAVNAHAKLPRPQQSELVQPMAMATVEILHEAIHCVNALVDASPGTVPRDHEAHTHTACTHPHTVTVSVYRGSKE